MRLNSKCQTVFIHTYKQWYKILFLFLNMGTHTHFNVNEMQKLPHFTNMLLQTSGCAHITYSTHTIRKSCLGNRFIRIQASCNKELKKGPPPNFWHHFNRVWSISKALSAILFLIDTVCLMTVKWPKPYDKK